MRRFKLTKRKILIVLGIWLAIVVAGLAITALQVRQGNLRELKAIFLKQWSTPGSGETMIVFAPHCDDESIATGGLLRQAGENGANVWVVLMTNGDGFRAAAMLDNRSLKVSPRSFVEFGYRRQQETFSALEQFGVRRDHVITLGYPDRGLEPMWVANWKKFYRSVYTRDDHSPYSDAFTPHAAYTGSQLMSDVKKVLLKVNPDEIYIPHPNDQHPDHWATSTLVTAALYELGWLGDKKVALYLVHRGDWPVPQGLHRDKPMVPPAKLAALDTKWYPLALDPSTVQVKGRAIASFQSQPPNSRRFLRSFERTDELFGVRPGVQPVDRVSAMQMDGKTNDWDGISPAVVDPSDDGLATHSRPSADLTAIYAAEDSGKLYFRIDVRARIDNSTTYELWVHPMGTADGTTRISVKRGCKPPIGWNVAFGKHELELSCPADKWKGRPILIAASTKSKWLKLVNYQIDRTAYSILEP